MGFNDFILFEPAPSSALDHMDEIESEARRRLATRMQSSLRNVVDPGVDLQAATRAQEIKVVSDGERFVVHRESQAGPLEPKVPEAPPEDPNEVGNIDQLFEMGSGVPTTKADGSLVYRTISPEALFGEQKRSVRTQLLEQAVSNSLSTDLVDSYDEAINDVRQRVPGSK